MKRLDYEPEEVPLHASYYLEVLSQFWFLCSVGLVIVPGYKVGIFVDYNSPHDLSLRFSKPQEQAFVFCGVVCVTRAVQPRCIPKFQPRTTDKVCVLP